MKNRIYRLAKNGERLTDRLGGYRTLWKIIGRELGEELKEVIGLLLVIILIIVRARSIYSACVR